MSPLTHSLLALAFLLFAVDAQNNCKQVIFGDRTNSYVELPAVKTGPGGGRVTITDGCPEPKHAVGEFIKACNAIWNGAAPNIQEVNPPYLSPVDVVCTDGCRNGTDVYITVYCN